MIKRSLVISLIMLCICSFLTAQELLTSTSSRKGMNSIFLEVGGNGIFGTLNYERMINSKMGLRVGGIFLPFSDTEHPLFGTLMINWILGKDNLRMEIGQGIFIYGGGWEEFSHSGSIFFTATIGIRYQPKIKGIILRLGFTPLFGPDRVYPWAGASIGYSFR